MLTNDMIIGYAPLDRSLAFPPLILVTKFVSHGQGVDTEYDACKLVIP